jgi:hypothetical protein
VRVFAGAAMNEAKAFASVSTKLRHFLPDGCAIATRQDCG